MKQVQQDQPCFDPVAYGSGPNDSVKEATENAAITHHELVLGGKTIPYTATAGHLVAIDASSSQPAAKIFYVAFTADGADANTRPVTFLYNGGPGSSAVWVLLGSFAPKRIKTNLPGFTPPAPYAMEDNPDSLLDKTDLVFINPVGTGFSAAIAPFKNSDFWGVDLDAASLRQFIKRYLSANSRWNSPKFLYGESYGTARSCVLAWMLHEDGIDLNGIALQSSILDYKQWLNPVGTLPTLAADAFYHQTTNVTPPPPDLPSFVTAVTSFAQDQYAPAIGVPPEPTDLTSFMKVVQTLSDYIGIPPVTLISTFGMNVASAANSGLLFLVMLLQADGDSIGAYDGRVKAIDTGIAASICPLSGLNDATIAAVSGAYTAMWNEYLNKELQFTSTSSFIGLNLQIKWNYSHIDPTGAEKGKLGDGTTVLYTAGDLAATMVVNTFMKVLALSGYYDSVTPFHQTMLDLENMPLKDSTVKANLTHTFYESGHMIYLYGPSRTQMKAHLAKFYDNATANLMPLAQLRARGLSRRIARARFDR